MKVTIASIEKIEFENLTSTSSSVSVTNKSEQICKQGLDSWKSCELAN